MVGKQFVALHHSTEELYDDLFEKFDENRWIKIKMRDEKPLARVEDYLKNTSVKEIDKDKLTCDEVLNEIEKDYTNLKKLATEIRNAADEENDFEVVAIMEDHVADYSKTLWFVRAMKG